MARGGPSHAGPQLQDPLTEQAIVEISWAADDALASSRSASRRSPRGAWPAAGRQMSSVALGNIVLADHGLTLADEPLGVVPQPLALRHPSGAGACARVLPSSSRRFRPRAPRAPLPRRPALRRRPMTTWPVHPDRASARCCGTGGRPTAIRADQTLGRTLPSGTHARPAAAVWPTRASSSVEIESDRYGATPLWRRHARAAARPLARLQRDIPRRQRRDAATSAPVASRTWWPAARSRPRSTACATRCRRRGGVDPEPVEDVRRSRRGVPHPGARRHRRRLRAQWSSATPRSRRPPRRSAGPAAGARSSSPSTVAGERVDAAFDGRPARLRRALPHGRATTSRSTRRATCRSRSTCRSASSAEYFRSDVKAGAARGVRQAAMLPDGRRGPVFHPDNFTFGQPVYLSHACMPRRTRSTAWSPCRSRCSSARDSRIRSRSPTAGSTSPGWRSPASTTTRASRSAASSI